MNQLRDLADDILKKEMYTLTELLDILDIDDVEFQEIFLSANTKGMNKFNLRDRALHVLEGELLQSLFEKKAKIFLQKIIRFGFRIDSSS